MMTLVWDDSGGFILSPLEDHYSYEMLLSGTYTKINDGFIMVIDDPFTDSNWDESLRLEITAVSRSGHIKDIEFINIADWDYSLIEKIEAFLGNSDSNYVTRTPYRFDPLLPPDPSQPYDPPPVGITPDAPPEYMLTDIKESDLYGSWEYSHGDATYFFWTAEHVSFTEWYVTTSTADHQTFGDWTIDGNILTVKEFDNDLTYTFIIGVSNEVLIITDSDGDTGYFKKFHW